MADVEQFFRDLMRDQQSLLKRIAALEKAQSQQVASDTRIHLGRPQNISIVSGVLTPSANSYIRAAAETGTVDEITTITATHAGHVIVLGPANGPHTITVKDGVGNITLLNGDVVLDSSEKTVTLLYHEGLLAWIQTAPGSGGAGVENLPDLTDVTITGATNGQVLTYASGTWVNDDIPAEATPSLDDLTDVTITTPAANDVLTYDGANWVNAPINTVVSTTIPLIQTSWSSQSTATTSSTSFASKGIAITPRYNMKMYAVAFWGTHVSGASYVAHIVTYAAGVLTGIVATSATFTVTSETLTNNKRTWLKFSSPVSLTAGTDYAVLITRTDSTDTYALPIIFDANARTPFSTYNDDKNTFVVAEATLVGNESYTLNNNVTPNVLGWVWSYDAWDIAYVPS